MDQGPCQVSVTLFSFRGPLLEFLHAHDEYVDPGCAGSTLKKYSQMLLDLVLEGGIDLNVEFSLKVMLEKY